VAGRRVPGCCRRSPGQVRGQVVCCRDPGQGS
jgi:hypothetical protein